ncbi:hypothetical protein [Actomonas aquatica]|uniref:Uncharacterized protein n=1 Tax=Actomonas aquatica TaxID=2866162 RepID=A0ABZ1CDT3_9BACT|nr:hypothetical protein [Opitutus sp. WL0086]WRQ89848.1 hypothetical protein K1X11_010565 [Opitutus sp. WL0086]
MDWIFDNIQLLVIIGSSIAWWLTQQKKDSDDDQPKPSDRPGRKAIDWKREEQGGESDAARQVRERMRRLREQRGQQEQRQSQRRESPQSERPQPTASDIPPVLRELMGIPEPEPEPVREVRRPEPMVPPPLPRNEGGERMAAQMRELEAKQREAEAMASRVKGALPGSTDRKRRRRQHSASYGANTGGDMMSDRDFLKTLRDSRSARRAIILKEVLDRPVGLR